MLSLLLAPLFADHMVLQRGHANPVWGWDQPQQTITLTVEGTASGIAPVTVKAAADGSWRLECPELPVGGPYTLHVKGSTERVIADVLVGEVWLASGQSNMEFTLSNSDGAKEEIASAHHSRLRVATIAHAPVATPQTQTVADTTWAVCTPETAGYFSGVAYFFARELQRELDVPVGIVSTTWGGTRVEAWTSTEALRPVMDVDAELAAMAAEAKNIDRVRADHQAKLAAWAKSVFPVDESNLGERDGWARIGSVGTEWATMTLPGAWQMSGLAHNGAVWFRRTVAISAGQAGHDLVLNLGTVDDFDQTYFNGTLVGAHLQSGGDAYQIARSYTVPGALVRAGENVIAVRVFDQFGEGGFTGRAEQMMLAAAQGDFKQSLAGDWAYRVERVIPTVPNTVFATYPTPPFSLQPQNNISALYNGMIAPLVPYGLRGAIWYQGEANVAAHRSYHERFTAMIRDWRTRWGQGQFPFYFVQLANFQEKGQWPWLREAQAQTLAEPATGMAVTIDIGNPGDIHPRNKREVGRRLALLALEKTYGKTAVESSGPVLAGTVISGGAARIQFNHAAGLRVRAGDTEVRGFELAGADGVFHRATGKIHGESVVVNSADVVSPQSVRYAWADSPEANLENAAGLPAAPFRTDGRE